MSFTPQLASAIAIGTLSRHRFANARGGFLGFHALWFLKGHELGVDRDEHTSRGFKRMLGGSLYRDERRRARDLIKQTPELYRILRGLEVRKQDPDGVSEPECVP